MTPASVIPVLGSRRPYADLNFATGSFGLNGTSVSSLALLAGFTFTRASTAMGFGSNGLLQSFASNTARLVYDPVTLASQGVLVEEARTNLCLQSQTFDNASWSKTRSTITADATTSPDGTSNADKFENSGTAGTHLLYQAATVTNAAIYTESVYAKKGAFDWIVVDAFDVGARQTWFNLNTGVVGTNAAGSTASITSVGNGWYRCSVTRAVSGTTLFIQLALAEADGALTTNAGHVFVFGAQIEAGAGASSYIPTTTASATRAADVAVITGLSVLNPHSLVCEWLPYFDSGVSFRRIAALQNAALSSEDSIYQRHSTNAVRALTSADMDLTLGTGNAAASNKAAARFETNNGSGSLNGAAAVAADTSTAPTTGIDRLYIGGVSGATSIVNGTISRIRIYNRALSDAELQAITT